MLATGANAHMLLGPRRSRIPHDQQERLEINDYTLFPRFLRHRPEVRRVTAGSLLWTPFDLLRTFSFKSSADYAYAFLVRPSRLTAGLVGTNAADDATVQLALPKNSFLSLAVSPEELRLHDASDIRLIDVHVLPLSQDGTVFPQPEFHTPEVVLHLSEPSTFPAAGQFLRGIGGRLEDLTLRLRDPHGIVEGQVLGLQACVSLVSLTLCLSFIPGPTASARHQWLLTLALLRSVAPLALRRVRLVVVIAATNGLCDSTASQVKQTRWHDLGTILTRFPNIQEVAVAVLGEGFHDSEVWQDVEFALRGVLPRGIRIVYDQGCIL